MGTLSCRCVCCRNCQAAHTGPTGGLAARTVDTSATLGGRSDEVSAPVPVRIGLEVRPRPVPQRFAQDHLGQVGIEGPGQAAVEHTDASVHGLMIARLDDRHTDPRIRAGPDAHIATADAGTLATVRSPWFAPAAWRGMISSRNHLKFRRTSSSCRPPDESGT